MLTRFGAVFLGLALLAPPALAQEAPRSPTPKPVKLAAKVTDVAVGLEHPWGVELLPDGRFLVTERPGRLRVVNRDGRLSAPLTGVPEVYARGQGGLLDVALSPGFAQDRLVYLSFAERGSGGAGTAVARGRLGERGLEDTQVIWRQQPKVDGSYNHWGSRLVFRPDGTLFVTLGDRFVHSERAQDLSTTIGKIVRINPDGSVPRDNPFVGRAGALPEIWSYGHRNVQAAVLDARGELWTVEHGARGGDELNNPQPGKNYGWPVITYGMNYDGTPITNLTAKEGLEQPVTYWTPSIAVCAIDFYVGDRFPRWKGDLLVSSLAAEELRRLRIDGGKLVKQEVLFKGIGRLRDVVVGPDGLVYVAFNVPDRIARLVPVP